MSLEAEFVDWLKEQVGRHEALCVGIGDDGAVVRWGDADKHGGEAVVVADLLAEGTHFVLDVLGPRRVGRKALAVNLSDLAAMAAIPVAATVSVLLPRMNAQWIARELFEGLLPLAREFNVAIAGGDTNTWSGPLVIDVTVWGRLTPSGPLLRSAAQVGDRILVTGRLGGSILGRHADFQPRIDEALALRTEYGIAAGMDISDGLALDLSRLATASGVGAILDVDHVPVHDDAHRLSADTSQGLSVRCSGPLPMARTSNYWSPHRPMSRRPSRLVRHLPCRSPTSARLSPPPDSASDAATARCVPLTRPAICMKRRTGRRDTLFHVRGP
ncbi:MAG: thiamine-phosphate kinase [Pirellulales bacterium]